MLGQHAAERAAALEALRARDPRLADDVARLLRDHESAQAGGFLEQGPDALLTTASAPDADVRPATAVVPRRCRRAPSSAATGCAGCSAAAAWASSTKPRRSRAGGASR